MVIFVNFTGDFMPNRPQKNHFLRLLVNTFLILYKKTPLLSENNRGVFIISRYYLAALSLASRAASSSYIA